MTERTPLPPINFTALADALLTRIDTLVPMWLPGGTVKNQEYFVHSVFRSEKTPSLSVKMSGKNAGCWRDHGGDDVGGDLISLYAAIHGMTMGAAAVELAREHGVEDIAGVTHARDGADQAPRPVRPAPTPAAAAPRIDEGWRTVTPVPDLAPNPTFKHPHRAAEDIEHTATYRIDGKLFGYVVRFKTSGGGKETLPYTWCISARDGAARWHWKQWDEPRPLFFPGGVSPQAHRATDNVSSTMPTIVVVEGEKKATILQSLLDEHCFAVYKVATWPGGCKAWKKADWAWLNGCTVVLWPDCDGKRKPLTTKERDALPDDAAKALAQAMQPLLPPEKQGGMAAMLGIGALLRDTQACTVQLLPIPEPLAVPDGWDCADAIVVDGWDGERVLAFFAQGHALPSVTGVEASTGASGGDAGDKNRDRLADAAEDDDRFREHLEFIIDSQKLKGAHEVPVSRKLLIAALRKAPALQGVLGYNELTGVPATQRAFPWRTDPGALVDSDDLALGDWISTKYGLKAASRAALSEALDTVADSRRYHPVRDWLRSLKHDGKPRIDKWLLHVLGLDAETLPTKLRHYLELVGRYMLLGLVARVMKPGCKFDYSPVLEGPGGIGKSTFIKKLVGEEFFSDTHFDIGQGKDGMEQFVGVWAYELSELTALRRADSEQVKQFFSSQKDRFRGAYGRYVQDHPRQLVIFCSTNKKQYLYDTTGNRRFWPFMVSKPVDLAWLQERRGQLFAEALALFESGAQIFPSLEDEEKYFAPEQEKRLVETSVQSRLYELLTRDGAPAAEGKASVELTVLTKFVTLHQLVTALGTDPGKASTLLESQIRGWLEANEWTYDRESTGKRRRGFTQPAKWPPEFEDEEKIPTRPSQADDVRGSDDDPF